MKKIILIVLIFTSFLFASINEYKSDVYFANGIDTKFEQAEEARDDLNWTTKTKYPESYKSIANWNVSYNHTHGIGIDFYESMLQKIDEHWYTQATLEVSDMLDYSLKGLVKMVAKKVAKEKIKEQSKKYAVKLAEKLISRYGNVYKGIHLTKDDITAIFEEGLNLAIEEATDAFLDIPEDEIKEQEAEDIKTQFTAYTKSIKEGHGVIVIAHSQGNLFTNLSYDMFENHWIPWEEDTAWMRTYFSAFAVASPANDILGESSPSMTFTNDIIQLVPDSMPAIEPNPTKYYYKNALGEKLEVKFSMKAHAFLTSYMKTDSTREKILGFIDDKVKEQRDDEIKRPSQWRTDEVFNRDTKEHRITVKHIEEDSGLTIADRVYPFNEDKKLYQVKDTVGALHYVKASFGGEEIQEIWNGQDTEKEFYKLQGTDPVEYIKGKVCKEVPMIPSGLFNAQLRWNEHNVEMKMTNSLMSQSVDGCGINALGSGSLSLYSVYPGTYPINATASGYESLVDQNISDTVTLNVHAVSANSSDSFTVTKAYQYAHLGLNGHLADIVITRPDPEKPPVVEAIPTVETIAVESEKDIDYGSRPHSQSNISVSDNNHEYSSGGTSDTIPSVQIDPPMCDESCGCLPCEYEILSYLNQTRLGPISGAKVILYKATQENDTDREILYEGSTTTSNKIDKAGILSLPIPYPEQEVLDAQEQALMDKISDYEGDFILEVSGGFDIDKNDDFKVDSTFTQLNGKLHLILDKERLLDNDYKVNILTEIAYQLSTDLLGDNYDKIRLQERLDDIAKRVLIEKLYPVAEQTLGRYDLFYWIPSAHKNWLIKSYDSTLAPIVEKIYKGENIYEDAYRYVYEEIKETQQQNSPEPILASQWIKVSEDIIAPAVIGKIMPRSEGNSTITSYQLSGEGSDIFSTDVAGEVSIDSEKTVDFEQKKLYQMQLIAENSDGESRPVTLYIVVGNVVDSPEDTSFEGGVIPEDAISGDIAGIMHFDVGASAIERIEIGGVDKEAFEVDLEGTIMISDNSNFDYEKQNYAEITIQAFNAEGSSRIIPITFTITDVVDVPIVQILDVHLSEDAVAGHLVGGMTILSDEPLTEIIFSGDGNENFTIDLNATVKIADGASLDYETRSNYVFKVQATNTQGTSRYGTLVIRLDDVMDVPELKNTTLRMLEFSPIASIVGEVTIGSNGTSQIESFMLGGNGSENFKIYKTGLITVDNDQLSRSDQEFFNLYATATNSDGESRRVGVVIYMDSKRPRPGILDGYAYENASVGTSIGKVPFANSTLAVEAIRLEGEGSENFTINLEFEVKIAEGAVLDYEIKNRYALQVIATNSAGESDPMPLYVRIIDIDDTIKISGFSTTIYEDIDKESTLGMITVIATGGSVIDHYVLTGAGSENFVVNAEGMVSIADNASFDSNSFPKYHLSLIAEDINSEKSNEVYLDITVAKSINTIPQVSDLSVSVKEDKNIADIIAHADIISKTQIVEQVWLTGDGSDDFEIDRYGAIRIKHNLDFETKKSYGLPIFARNSLGQSQPAQLTVAVINVIDDEPILAETIASVEENATIGTAIGTIVIKSMGASPIEKITLTGSGSSYFRVDNQGVLYTTNNLNYENKVSYNLTAIAINNKATSEAVSVTITVQNISEHIPVLYEFKGFVEDNASVGTAIGDVKFATKGDSQIVGYTLSGQGKENFEIDSNGTLRISAATQLDETIQKVYTLSLTAKNEAGDSNPVVAIITLTHEKVKPQNPSNLKLVDIGHNSITLGWVDRSNNEQGFNLYKDGVKYKVLDKDSVTISIDELQEETSYIFTLKSFNDRGESLGVSIEAITDIDRSEYLKNILTSKCSISESTFYSQFNTDTGVYSGSISCTYKGLTDEDLLNFKALKEITGTLDLRNNQLTNVDGLSNLKRAGYHLSLHNNQLENVDGLSKLESVRYDLYLYNNKLTNVNGLSSLKTVGRYFDLYDNQLTNVNGLSSLTSVGNRFYLYNNKLTNLDGLSSLTSVGNNLNFEGNQLTNLDGLNKLTNLGGYLALRGNETLTDISGVSNIQGNNGQILYVDLGQYDVKADQNLNFCSTAWDLRDTNGDTDDDMTQVCAQGAELTDVQKLRIVMESKCSVSYSQFADKFEVSTGVYDGSLDCSYSQMNDEDLVPFTLLTEIKGSFSINHNNLTNVDGLSNLSSIGRYFYLNNNKIADLSGLNNLTYIDKTFDISDNNISNLNDLFNLTTVGESLKIYHNSQLEDIMGLSNIRGVDGKKIYIDTTEYITKADLAEPMCSVKWDIYDTSGNIDDDMSKICEGYNYEPTSQDELRDLLGKRCSIDSSTFYSNFIVDLGIYGGNILCQSVVDEDMDRFKALLEVDGNFAIENSDIINLDGLFRLKKVTGSVSIWNNSNLINIQGLSNITSATNHRLTIDNFSQYDIKADSTKEFCATNWDIYEGTDNIENDMSNICTE